MSIRDLNHPWYYVWASNKKFMVFRFRNVIPMQWHWKYFEKKLNYIFLKKYMYNFVNLCIKSTTQWLIFKLCRFFSTKQSLLSPQFSFFIEKCSSTIPSHTYCYFLQYLQNAWMSTEESSLVFSPMKTSTPFSFDFRLSINSTFKYMTWCRVLSNIF